MVTTLVRGRTALAAFAFGLLVLSSGPSLAAGNDSGDSTTCQRGEVYDSRTQKCMKQRSGVLPDKNLTDYAYVLAKAERYDEAIEVLDLLKNPNSARALNYRGYATRKLGRVDEGIDYYLRSVARAPRYVQVREYLGEAYVEKGDMVRAKEQLRAIKSICGTRCEEYEDLAKAIAERTTG